MYKTSQSPGPHFIIREGYYVALFIELIENRSLASCAECSDRSSYLHRSLFFSPINDVWYLAAFALRGPHEGALEPDSTQATPMWAVLEKLPDLASPWEGSWGSLCLGMGYSELSHFCPELSRKGPHALRPLFHDDEQQCIAPT